MVPRISSCTCSSRPNSIKSLCLASRERPWCSASDLEHQLRSSGVKALFTCASRLEIAAKAAKAVGIPQERIFILATPDDNSTLPFTTFDDLVKEGADLPKLEPLKWVKGQGARQVAFLCYSSGTSGFPVPPIIIRIIHDKTLCSKYDLSSVRWLYTVVCTTSEDDIDIGSSGSLVPATKAMIIDIETGEEITEYNKPGELLVQTPSLVLGYMNNERATSETFIWRKDGRWIRTGDEVLIRLAPSGNEHLVVVDRLKELIKVNGHQVAPAELEAHLLSHPYVSDCAVIQTPNDKAGEVPKAYIVKSDACGGQYDDVVARAICKHVEDHKQRYKWLGGGVEFIKTIPKSPSGKILRRLLRDKQKEARKSLVAKL
ncbi:hypothetical protein LZL87_011407 [Fusarium oxysporum]|nr:hypothetical protein LZL87_011407 [Fusarium oxysporum]